MLADLKYPDFVFVNLESGVSWSSFLGNASHLSIAKA